MEAMTIAATVTTTATALLSGGKGFFIVNDDYNLSH
jgi:hypothetical protein